MVLSGTHCLEAGFPTETLGNDKQGMLTDLFERPLSVNVGK